MTKHAQRQNLVFPFQTHIRGIKEIIVIYLEFGVKSRFDGLHHHTLSQLGQDIVAHCLDGFFFHKLIDGLHHSLLVLLLVGHGHRHEHCYEQDNNNC